MQKVYISGPMTGIPDHNYPLFNQTAKELRAKGYGVVNPAETSTPTGSPWETYMRDAITRMMVCDTILLLPGWENSRGACLEERLAGELGFKYMFLTPTGIKSLEPAHAA